MKIGRKVVIWPLVKCLSIVINGFVWLIHISSTNAIAHTVASEG